MIRTLQHSLILAALAFTVTACESLPQRPESASRYSLELPADAQLPAFQRHRGTLMIGRIDAGPALDTSQMAYAEQAYQISYYTQSRWAERPANMLGPVVTEALEQSGLFRNVLRQGGYGPADYRLDLQLVRLIHDFTTNPSTARLVLRAQLVDVVDGRVLGTHRISTSEQMRSDDAQSGVTATNRTLADTVRQLLEFLEEALPAAQAETAATAD